MRGKKLPCYAFIDAANLFYGGQKSLGWSIDYKKLFKYLKQKFKTIKVYYYAGIEIENFPYNPLSGKDINLEKLTEFLQFNLESVAMSQENKERITKSIKRIKFYKKLSQFGYILKLKPTKIYKNRKYIIKKANCDVDLTFDLIRLFNKYSEIVILSGDGDFLPVLLYLKKNNKKVNILARGERSAKEIRQLAGNSFMDFNYLREKIKFEKK